MSSEVKAQSAVPVAQQTKKEAEPATCPHPAPLSVAPRARAKLHERFNIHHRLQHAGVFTSFTVCALTGLPIKYSDAGWALALAGWLGGIDTVLTIHLAAAVVLIAASLYHLVYLIMSFFQGKRSLAALPNWKDVVDVFDNIRYRFGLTERPPRYDRYSYKEKFDYWAVFWGMFIMAGSGLMLWFPGIAGQFVPRWLIESSRVAHSDEAMLAILAIVVWHFFNVHFNPTNFPANWAFFNGTMSAEEMKREHPMEWERVAASVGDQAAQEPAKQKPAKPEAAPHSRLDRSWVFVTAEIAVYLVVLALFLRAFLPIGLQ